MKITLGDLLEKIRKVEKLDHLEIHRKKGRKPRKDLKVLIERPYPERALKGSKTVAALANRIIRTIGDQIPHPTLVVKKDGNKVSGQTLLENARDFY